MVSRGLLDFKAPTETKQRFEARAKEAEKAKAKANNILLVANWKYTDFNPADVVFQPPLTYFSGIGFSGISLPIRFTPGAFIGNPHSQLDVDIYNSAQFARLAAERNGFIAENYLLAQTNANILNGGIQIDYIAYNTFVQTLLSAAFQAELAAIALPNLTLATTIASNTANYLAAQNAILSSTIIHLTEGYNSRIITNNGFLQNILMELSYSPIPPLAPVIPIPASPSS